MAQNNVFANDLEIACKAADGKSIAAFPDPCWSPPSPSAGWIVIPYANTALAKDTSNASKTVFISNKPIMKKDFSFFKKSTGDEAAAGPKGVKTGVKKGKAYFTSWSMNVKVEGKNVDRHTDGMTHNHGSFPGNTGQWTYVDTAEERQACKKDKEKMDKACEEKTQRRDRDGNMVDTNTAAARQTRGAWKRKHCGLLKLKPSNNISQDQLDEFAQQMQDFDLSEQAIKLKDEAFTAASDLLTDGLLEASTHLYKPIRILSRLETAGNMLNEFNPFYIYEQSQKAAAVIEAIRGEAVKAFEQVGGARQALTDMYQGNNVQENMSKIQGVYGLLEPCIRARKCMLVPYTQSSSKLSGNGGCCDGQTGHHLIPKSYFGTTTNGRFVPDRSICPDYNESRAPTTCVEGTNNAHGTHGQLHTKTDMIAEAAASAAGNFNYETASAATVAAHKSQFPLSFCSAKCLQAQLDNYHKNACNGGSNELMLKRTAATSPDGGSGADD